MNSVGEPLVSYRLGLKTLSYGNSANKNVNRTKNVNASVNISAYLAKKTKKQKNILHPQPHCFERLQYKWTQN